MSAAAAPEQRVSPAATAAAGRRGRAWGRAAAAAAAAARTRPREDLEQGRKIKDKTVASISRRPNFGGSNGAGNQLPVTFKEDGGDDAD